MVAAPRHLHPLPGRDEHGGLRAGAGRPTSQQPHAGPQDRQGAAHRLRRLLRGGHAEGEVPREGALPSHAHVGQRDGGGGDRGQLPLHLREGWDI